MTIKLTAASFLNGVRNSGLVEPSPLETVLKEMRAAGTDANDSQVIADELVRRDLVTSWQVEKLLQGRHKGFFLGRYRLLRLLGTGQMSAVYLGRHIYMDHLVAIKVLPADKVGDTSYLGRFYREAKAVASLNHPNVIRAFDVDKQVEAGTDIHFLVMEYIEGQPLTNLVADTGGAKLDLVFVANVIRQAAEGLAHAHDINMVHRDIKPDNLLITASGGVKILDLGLARFFKTTDEESLTLKHDERVIGTADYLAPEQAIDSHSVDSRADIYGLGCTFYYALTGHPPFTEGTLVQRLMAHQTQTPPPVTNDRPDVPESLQKILVRMLAKKRDERYQTGREVADDLTTWLVANASEDWKEKHLPMYAAIRLKEMIAASAGQSTTVPSDVAAMASKPDAHDVPIPRNTTPAKPRVPMTTSSKVSESPAAKRSTSRTAGKVIPSPPRGVSASAAAAIALPVDQQDWWELIKKHPAASLAIGLTAVVLLAITSLALFRNGDSKSATDRGPSETNSVRSV